MTWKDTQN